MNEIDPQAVLDILRAALRGIVANRIYTPAEAADLIGFRGDRAGKSIREIPNALLPCIPITPGGRIVGYLGRDLLRYIEERRATVAPSDGTPLFKVS